MKRRLWPLLPVAAGALWLLLLLASSASADIVDPGAPYSAPQPMRSTRLTTPATPDPVIPAVPAAAPEQAPATPKTAAPPEPSIEPVPTAAPAPVMSAAAEGAPEIQQAPVRARSRTPVGKAGPRVTILETTDDVRQPFEPIVETARRAVDQVRVFLAEVASACKVGVGTGSGGPVLVFAVLGMVTALERHRVLRARLATDEDMPEFLYAWDVIAPG